jgi:plasmid stabilization system protein ParE
MPRAWSAKRERQYEHIKESVKEQGASEKKAEEIAARTVNKERAQAGEAKTSSRLSREDMSPSRRGGLRSGTDRPKGRTKAQLYNEARKLNVEGRSSMDKAQLQRAVDRHK